MHYSLYAMIMYVLRPNSVRSSVILALMSWRISKSPGMEASTFAPVSNCTAAINFEPVSL